ncbi:MAG TPA: zinc transporter ZntB [Kaistiaceae bacterium]|nr:zinc transporter ZntB [Kaistiaceae bacterium]
MIEMASGLSALVFDADGAAHPIAEPEIIAVWQKAGNNGGPGEAAFLWVHLHAPDEAAREALSHWAGLGRSRPAALVAAETRPRCDSYPKGLLLNLRGVNVTPGAEPDDLVSVRLWIEAHRILSVSYREMHALDDLRTAVARGRVIANTGEFVAELALRIANAMEPVIEELSEQIDDLEDEVATDAFASLRRRLSEARRQATGLHRFIAPQRMALDRLAIEAQTLFAAPDRNRLREAADHVTRFSEELSMIHDRASILQEEITDKRAEVLNQRMLVLSVAAAVFLPLNLIVGALGMNVGGIPGAGSAGAFWGVSIVLAAIAVGGIFLARWKRWL